jgi:hypothetical protein
MRDSPLLVMPAVSHIETRLAGLGTTIATSALYNLQDHSPPNTGDADRAVAGNRLLRLFVTNILVGG